MQDRSSLALVTPLALPTLAPLALAPSAAPLPSSTPQPTPPPLVQSYAASRAIEAQLRSSSIGATIRGWRVVAPSTRRGDRHLFECACEACGSEDRFSLAELEGAEASPPCLSCGANVPAELDERSLQVLARLASVPRLDPELAFVDDADAQAWIAEHPEGATLEEVGRAFGVSRERARQIEEQAIAKVARALGRAGVGAEMLEHLFRSSW